MHLCLDCWKQQQRARFSAGYRDCPACGDRYYQDEPWKRTCFSCWKAGKKGEARHKEHDETVLLRREITRLRKQLQQSQIDMTMYRRLLQLCHPDKHGGSIAAQTATKWLLGNRPEGR